MSFQIIQEQNKMFMTGDEHEIQSKGRQSLVGTCRHGERLSMLVMSDWSISNGSLYHVTSGQSLKSMPD
jgi:hypothetical protein